MTPASANNVGYRQRIKRLAEAQIASAAAAYRDHELDTAFRHLEDAHVLGQRHLATHWRVHLWMSRIGFRRRDLREVVGQGARLCFAPLGNLTGWLLSGNTGGAGVPASRPMPIAPHLQELLRPLASEERSDSLGAAASWVVGAAWWMLGLTIAVADWAVKSAVQNGMPYGEVIPITGFFNLVHAWNTGAAFSFLADAGGWQRYFLIAVALGAAVVLAWWLCRPQPRVEAIAYSLILGGALGNAFDRIVRGYVVDYLDFHWAGWHWPAFNVADIAICTGAAVLIWTAFRTRPRPTGLMAEARGLTESEVPARRN